MKYLPFIALLALPACASITSGTTQSIAVQTSPSGAECDLSNDKGKWYVKSTPDSATVNRSYSALAVNCRKGKLTGSEALESTTTGSTFGNILAGGIIGAAVDMESGAAYQYPASVNVKLGK